MGWARHFVTGLSSLRDRAAARLAALRFNPSRDEPDLPECRNCRYADSGAYPMTYCHRYAPREHRAQGQNTFPQVSTSDWCGEYEPR